MRTFNEVEIDAMKLCAKLGIEDENELDLIARIAHLAEFTDKSKTYLTGPEAKRIIELLREDKP